MILHCMEIGGLILGCTGTPSTGPEQCQDTLAAPEAVLLGGQCPTAGLSVDFHPPSPRGTPLPADTPIPASLLFPVKFRIVSLDKDFTPSNKKVRAGLGKGGGDRAPLHCSPTVSASRERGVGVTSQCLSPWKSCPSQLCLGGCAPQRQGCSVLFMQASAG